MRLTLLILGFAAILQSCGGYCESDTDCPDTKICAGYESLFWDGRVCVYSDKDLVLASDTTCTQTEGTCMDMDQDGFAGTGDCNLEFPFLDCNDRREDIYPGVPERCDGIDNKEQHSNNLDIIYSAKLFRKPGQRILRFSRR